MQPTHVFVTAAEGRLVPVPPNEASAPGSVLLKCEAGKVYRLPWSSYVRRRILAGDLLLCNQWGTKVSDASAAEAPVVKLDDTGAVAADQRADEIILAELEAKAAAKLPKFDTSDAKE
jgi:hypothetical protein